MKKRRTDKERLDYVEKNSLLQTEWGWICDDFKTDKERKRYPTAREAIDAAMDAEDARRKG